MISNGPTNPATSEETSAKEIKMAKRNTFTRRDGSTFTCDICGRRTRYTGVQSVGSKLCPQCWDRAGIENEILDGYSTLEEKRAEIEQLEAEIRAKGGVITSMLPEKTTATEGTCTRCGHPFSECDGPTTCDANLAAKTAANNPVTSEETGAKETAMNAINTVSELNAALIEKRGTGVTYAVGVCGNASHGKRDKLHLLEIATDGAVSSCAIGGRVREGKDLADITCKSCQEKIRRLIDTMSIPAEVTITDVLVNAVVAAVEKVEEPESSEGTTIGIDEPEQEDFPGQKVTGPEFVLPETKETKAARSDISSDLSGAAKAQLKTAEWVKNELKSRASELFAAPVEFSVWQTLFSPSTRLLFIIAVIAMPGNANELRYIAMGPRGSMKLLNSADPKKPSLNEDVVTGQVARS